MSLVLVGIVLLSLNLRPAAVSVGPVLDEIRAEFSMSGASAGLLTSLPVIGFAGRHRRLLFAFGHGHIGFSTGPITGQLAAQLIGGEATSVPVDAYAPSRFKA